MLEVSLNGKRVTLRRDAGEARQQPMYIYWGGLEEAASAGITAWEVYPFKRSQNKLSFTQALLLALDMPSPEATVLPI